MTIDDLTFSVPYCITATRNDYLDALVAYFTVEFTRSHKRTGITTGQYIHVWRGITVYIYDGEYEKGSIVSKIMYMYIRYSANYMYIRYSANYMYMYIRYSANYMYIRYSANYMYILGIVLTTCTLGIVLYIYTKL